MTERIDHAAEARRLQEVARGIITDNPTAFAPHMAAVILLDEARLEAQLALVEQQRFANVIAYLSADVIGGGPGSSGAIDDIREALGLS